METEAIQRLKISEEEFLKEAVRFLENPNVFMNLANKLGAPVEKSLSKLPEKYTKAISEATRNALYKAVEVLANTVEKKSMDFKGADKETKIAAYNHTVLAFGVGAAGGFLGIASLPLELPAATAVMLRSILNIAQEFGMDVKKPDVQMECLYILTLGSPETNKDDQLDSAYWASRIGFSSMLNQAAKHLAAHGLKALPGRIAVETAPALTKLLSAVATRYEVVVTRKVISGAVPVIGALGGGTINAAFTDYFSRAARFHFGMKNLEIKYGSNFVQEQYAFIKKSLHDEEI